MSVTCPNCGKPVRQGAKYCGSCRMELPASFSVTPVPRPVPGAQGTPPAGGTICAKCGTVVRQGARFCPRCGSSVQTQPAPQQNLASVQPAGQPPVQPSENAAQGKPGPKKFSAQALLILATLLVLCCGVSAAAVLTRERWTPGLEAVLGRASAERTVTPTEAPTIPPTSTPTMTATVELPTATATLPAPTDTPEPPTPTPPLTQKASETPVPPTEEAPLTIVSPVKTPVLSEDFTGTLEHWKLSAQDEPTISKEGEKPVLVFMGGEASALYSQPFELKPGMIIEFVMQVDPEEEKGLHFRWIPGNAEPSDFEQQGSIKVDVENAKMHFALLRARTKDEIAKDVDHINGNMQIYTILVKSDLSVSFSVNGTEIYAPPDKVLSPAAEANIGYLVFYGKGKLSSVTVSKK